MEISKHFAAQLALLVSFCHLLCQGLAVTASQSCNTSDTCNSFIGYIPPNNVRIRDVAELFGVDTMAVLGANDVDITLPDLENVVVPSGKFLKIPQSCACIKGVRHVNSTIYTVKTGDDLSTIAGYYGNLITYQEIANTNNISNPNLIFPDQQLVIPLPCGCYNGSYQGQPAFLLTYQVQSGQTLATIANDYNTTVVMLTSINHEDSVSAKDVIEIPIAACKSSFNRNSADYGLTVARGSYIITAESCVQCSCGNKSTDVYCNQAPESFSSSCSNLTCTGTNLTIGEFSTKEKTSNCLVNTCSYNGYINSTIMSRLLSETDPTCPAPPPPAAYYKPPTGLAASPLSAPIMGGSGPPSGSGPSVGMAGAPHGQSNAVTTASNSFAFAMLGLCLPLLIHFDGW
eukprot:c23812_g1_i1 orf=272-1474(-)